MNGTIIDIPGVTVDVIKINLEHSTDTSYLLSIRDSNGNLVNIKIINGKIDGTHSYSKHK